MNKTMTKATSSSSAIFGIAPINLINNYQALFSEICTTCFSVVKNNLHIVCINSIKLNAQKILLVNKLYVCCPELDQRNSTNAILCANCFGTVNIMYEFNCRFDKSKWRFYEDVPCIFPLIQNCNLFEHYNCKDEIKTEEIDINDIQKVPLIKHTQIQSIIKPIKRLQHNFKTNTCIEGNPFKCSMCDYSSTRKCNLKRHFHIHTGEKHVKCSYCNFRCIEKSQLKNHLYIHTGERPFKCTMCDYSTSRERNLKRHFHIHTGEKHVKCSYCDFRCIEKFQLKRHLYIHTGEKPFKCSVCVYSSATKSSLKIHLRIHTGERPFKCFRCDYNGVTKSELKKHLYIHTGEKPFKCSACSYSSALKSNLTKHYRNIHKMEEIRSKF